MASCNVLDGIGRPPCPGETPGVRDTFYIFNWDAATFVAGAGTIIEDITFSAGQGYFQVIAKKGSVEGREEKQDNDNASTDYTKEVDFRLADLSNEARDFVDNLNGTNIGVIIHTKGDKFLLFGYTDGMFMAVNNMSTTSEELGEFVTFRETESNEKRRTFFDTDAATTESNITSKIIGS